MTSCLSLVSYWNAPIEDFWPAGIARLAEEAKNFPIKDGERVLIEIENDQFVPIFVYYLLGPKYLRDVSYPNLWSGSKSINKVDPRYRLYYNIPCLDAHNLKTTMNIPNADWLFLFYSDSNNVCWDGTFRDEYQQELIAQGHSSSLSLFSKTQTGHFILEIYKVQPQQ